ncbi:ATP-binding protein [uncultured Actinomyces sp.]|uniref:ATP-binding protein n=1 Tax=uncultured Actinomyces sp. TaxID=249061 RepID=UPI00288A860B|nr:ATP-binding protein [uncultured Actinomyces sp.]
MTEEELETHVERIRRQGRDDALVEAKAAEKDLPKSMWDTVSAFANTDGGLIILGLDERTGFAPTEGFDPNRVVAQVISGLDQASGAQPKVQPVPNHRVDRLRVDDAEVLGIEIDPLRDDPSRPGPCYVEAKGVLGGSFKRVDDHDKRLTAYEIYLLQMRRVEDGLDRAPVAGTDLSDLSEDLVSRTIDGIRRSRSRALHGIEAGDRAGALRRINALTRDGEATLAGYLAMGVYPQQEFPQLTIDVAVHPGTAKSQDPATRFLDRQNCDGPAPEAIQDAVRAVLRNLSTRRVVDGVGGRNVPEIPEEVLREAIANAVMHRDYSAQVRGQQIAVDVYSDRVEVISPGGFWGGRTKDNLDEGHSESRNPDLARLLTCVPMPDDKTTVCENQGSGVPLMIGQMRRHGLPAPDYSASTLDHVVVRLARLGLMNPQVDDWLAELPGAKERGREQRAALALVKQRGAVSVSDLRANFGLDSDDCREVLAALVADGLLIGLNDGTYVLTDLDRTMQSTGAQRQLLAALDEEHPRSIHEIAEITGKSPGALRPVLRELVGRGLVEATAQPQSRNRRYLLAPRAGARP